MHTKPHRFRWGLVQSFYSSATNKFSNFVYDETLCATTFTRFALAAVDILPSVRLSRLYSLPVRNTSCLTDVSADLYRFDERASCTLCRASRGLIHRRSVLSLPLPLTSSQISSTTKRFAPRLHAVCTGSGRVFYPIPP